MRMKRPHGPRAPSLILAGVIVAGLSACGGQGTEATSEAMSQAASPAATPLASTGQVAATTSFKVSQYAASRFADQVSFGATPALVQEIRSKGFEKWLDDQFALPLTPINPAPVEVYPTEQNPPSSYWNYLPDTFMHRVVVAPDQLRQRVLWSLSQWVVAATTKGEPAGWVYWVNTLERNAFGNYRNLLREASTNPHMAHYLDNDQNRPKSDECQHCAPNENYARELMQLFSLGVVKLNSDGTTVRDARGRPVETYTQRDVEELARVLTGWTHDPDPPNRPNRNWGNWSRPMVPSTWPPERDAGAKSVLGKFFPAGQAATRDLEDTLDLLMSHQNIAPFVALRMIQHLVKSDPTPAYVGRVASAFRNNGQAVAGDMKAVVKAVLLDPEARAADDPAKPQNGGKFREPMLHRTAVLRGLGCGRWLAWPDGNLQQPSDQRPFASSSVFSFYAPTDRAPGSNLLAPEQKLASARELTARLGELQWVRWTPKVNANTMDAYRTARCDIDRFTQAYARSPKEFIDLLSERWFRGAMPPTLRSNIEQQIRKPTWDTSSPDEGTVRMLMFAVSSPYFGAVK